MNDGRAMFQLLREANRRKAGIDQAKAGLEIAALCTSHAEAKVHLTSALMSVRVAEALLASEDRREKV